MAGRLVIIVLLLLALTGCKVSREIIQLERPSDLTPLPQLERHMDYVDPDDGKPDYLIERG